MASRLAAIWQVLTDAAPPAGGKTRANPALHSKELPPFDDVVTHSGVLGSNGYLSSSIAVNPMSVARSLIRSRRSPNVAQRCMPYLSGYMCCWTFWASTDATILFRHIIS